MHKAFCDTVEKAPRMASGQPLHSLVLCKEFIANLDHIHLVIYMNDGSTTSATTWYYVENSVLEYRPPPSWNHLVMNQCLI